MASLYAAANVVLCPSIRPEGLGMVALESQACATPVVTSGLGGLGEATLMSDFIADPRHGSAFAAAILAATSLPRSCRPALRKQICDLYTLSASTDSLLEALLGAQA